MKYKRSGIRAGLLIGFMGCLFLSTGIAQAEVACVKSLDDQAMTSVEGRTIVEALTRTKKVMADLQKRTATTSEVYAIEMKDGRKIHVQQSILDPKKPTLILGPGIFMGIDARDPSARVFLDGLSRSGVNWLIYQTSQHFASVIEDPSSLKPGITLQQLQEEPMTVVKTMGIERPVFVTNSFSSVLTANRASTSLVPIIETSPMGRYDDEMPVDEVNSFIRMASNWSLPLGLGKVMYETGLKEMYRQYMSTVVSSLALTIPELGSSHANVASGLVNLAVAAEGFDMTKNTFTDDEVEGRRVFVLGGLEVPKRAEKQKETIRNYYNQTGMLPFVVYMEGSTHYIASSTGGYPLPYLQLLVTLSQRALPANEYGVRLDASNNWQPMTRDEVLHFIHEDR